MSSLELNKEVKDVKGMFNKWIGNTESSHSYVII